MPNCICQSIIEEYAKYYLKTLERHEREQYFQIENISSKAKAQATTATRKLINYYDLMAAFASRPEKCSLSTVDYRQCIWSHSTLDERIKIKLRNSQSKQPASEANAIDYDSSDLDENKVVKSLRSKQKPHLDDTDLRIIAKRQKNLTHLSVCPCMLTNRSVLIINNYMKQNLISLRFQNCCNWQTNSQAATDRNPAAPLQEANQLPHELNNDRLELRNFMDTDEEDDDDDDDEDDDDDDDDEERNDYYHDLLYGDRNSTHRKASSNVKQTSEETSEHFNLRPYFLDSNLNQEGYVKSFSILHIFSF